MEDWFLGFYSNVVWFYDVCMENEDFGEFWFYVQGVGMFFLEIGEFELYEYGVWDGEYGD